MKICWTSRNHAFFKIAESRANKDEGPKNITDVLDATVARIEQLFQQPHDGVTGVNTGYDDLNKKDGGFAAVRLDYRRRASVDG